MTKSISSNIGSMDISSFGASVTGAINNIMSNSLLHNYMITAASTKLTETGSYRQLLNSLGQQVIYYLSHELPYEYKIAYTRIWLPNLGYLDTIEHRLWSNHTDIGDNYYMKFISFDSTSMYYASVHTGNWSTVFKFDFTTGTYTDMSLNTIPAGSEASFLGNLYTRGNA